MSGRVTGFGGVFFRARDPDALTNWYQTHLGVPSAEPFAQSEGVSVFAPFKRDTDYWPAEKQWMLNFRVEGLEALIERLEAAGISVETRVDWNHPEIGNFARIVDPEGNNVELWEPPA